MTIENVISPMPAFIHRKDFWGGLMLVAIGALAVVLARDYPLGTALRMGPGYFPTLLGAVLVLFGLYLAAIGMRKGETIEGSWSFRALVIVPLSLVLFGFLMDRAGFIPALVVLIFGSAAASTEFRFVEVALLTVVLTAFAVVVFIFGLGLPYPLIAGL
jgi:putative tricarboxylic transport membrane protein